MVCALTVCRLRAMCVQGVFDSHAHLLDAGFDVASRTSTVDDVDVFFVNFDRTVKTESF